MPDQQQPAPIQKALNLPCPSCGSQLQYSAEKKSIACDYCGYREAIDNSKDRVVERSLATAMQDAPRQSVEAIDKKVFECQSCASRFMVESSKVKVSCGFCGSRNVNLEAFEHQYIQPGGIIPFYIARREAEERFKQWIRKGFFHPNKLKSLAALEDLHGIYIPFWTYDAQTEAQWRGEAGRYYYESERVNVNGKWETRTVQKIRWEHRSGTLRHFFDDVLVSASGGLPQREMQGILPFQLEEVVNYDPRLLLGWEGEIYNVEVDAGYQQAEEIMDSRLRVMCAAQLGGDTQRNLQVRAEKWAQTFKHIILPVWICSYRYNDKVYRFIINGQTGRVSGQKPISWVKIALLVLLFALFLLAVYALRESGVLQG